MQIAVTVPKTISFFLFLKLIPETNLLIPSKESKIYLFIITYNRFRSISYIINSISLLVELVPYTFCIPYYLC